ncbi:MAG TPA: hypothetical protein VIJ11_02145 [Galbitalea sp.]
MFWIIGNSIDAHEMQMTGLLKFVTPVQWNKEGDELLAAGKGGGGRDVLAAR